MKNIIKYPFYLLDVLGTGKSFLQNPVLGSEKLNLWGLHKWRVQLADKMATFRRRHLGALLTCEDRDQLDSKGYLLKENFLPDPVFEQLKHDIYSKPVACREMRQGQTVTRMVPLGPRFLQSRQGLTDFLCNKYVRDAVYYAASYGGEPVYMINVIIVNPDINETDPQTDLHSDTFHATAKAWLFLHDVGMDDGPFVYVPGSQKLTRERLQWEYMKSLNARSDPREHHRYGSFRISPSELQDFGFYPKTLTVRANTLVIADTRGFHGRTPSYKPGMRVSVYAYLRRNPFQPWTGANLSSLPFLKYRSMDIYLAYLDFLERRFGKRSIWRDAGEIQVDAPSNL